MPESLPEPVPGPFLNVAEEAVATTDATPRGAWLEPPTGGRELIAVGLLVLLGDLTIYRGQGFAGLALLFAVVPWLLAFGAWQRSFRVATWVTAGFLAMVSIRLLWSGGWLATAVGVVFVLAFTMALHGCLPYLPELARFSAQLFLSAFLRIDAYLKSSAKFKSQADKPSRAMEYLLPLGALVAFGGIFVFANPSLLDYVTDGFERIARELKRWFANFSMVEVLFCAVVAWFGFGVVRPRLEACLPFPEPDKAPQTPQPSPLYRPFRNTLIAVVLLFAVYLLFEWATLWFRELPEGFYYAGYAHQGAAWLTIALALATLTLSLIFRGPTMRDPRSQTLKRLAWIWSAQNFVLALAVLNRMHLYVDFNGMTRMRTVGLFGIATVVVGFVLVLIKISRGRSFRWLLRQQLWALGLAISIYALLPVDMLVHYYNVRRIMNGDLRAAVQISVHPIDDEGYLVLWPLLDCPDKKIRLGIQGMLAEKRLANRSERSTRSMRTEMLGWTAYQVSTQVLRDQLQEHQAALSPLLRDESARRKAIAEFNEYVYQWY